MSSRPPRKPDPRRPSCFRPPLRAQIGVSEGVDGHPGLLGQAFRDLVGRNVVPALSCSMEMYKPTYEPARSPAADRFGKTQASTRSIATSAEQRAVRLQPSRRRSDPQRRRR